MAAGRGGDRRPARPRAERADDQDRGGDRGGPLAAAAGRAARSPGADPNQRAIVLRVTGGGIRLLLTADAESDVLAPLDPGPVDVLKVSHHGSADDGPRAAPGRACVRDWR